jgi:hypothetical protein
MTNHRKSRLIALAGVVAAGTMALTTAPARSAATTAHEHVTFPAAGSVFTCSGGDLTATAGTVDEVIQTAVDAQAVVHVTGTITTHGVTLQDAAGSAYTLSGASWFGLKLADEQVVVITDTTHFVIHNATGGVYGKVQSVEHLSPNGKGFSFDFGTCEAPAD